MVATEVKKSNRVKLVYALSDRAVEWAKTNGYEQLMTDLDAFRKEYQTTGPGSTHAYSARQRYVSMTPDELSKLYMKYQRLLETVKEVQATTGATA